MDRQPTGLFDGELEQFMQAIRWEPDDNSLRQICADYLDERGHTWLSNLIREQLTSPDFMPTDDCYVSRNVNSELKHTYLHNLGLDPDSWSLVLGTRDRDEAAYASAPVERLEGLQYAFGNTLVLVDGFVEGICCMIGRLLNADAWYSPLRLHPVRHIAFVDKVPRHQEHPVGTLFGGYSLFHSSRLAVEPFVHCLPSVLFDPLKTAPGAFALSNVEISFPTRRRALAALSGAARGIFVPDFAAKQQEDSDD